MGSPIFSADPMLVLDTSTVININATRCAARILQSLPTKIGVVQTVVDELEDGRSKGRSDAKMLHQLVTDSLVNVVTLNDEGLEHFEKLVVGPAATTLDDGEAATIAYALANGIPAAIDERKATRICSEIFPRMDIVCTVDVLAHPEVRKNLGDEALSEAVFNALRYARMSVAVDHISWVIEIIGQERASTCISLPRSIRAAGGATLGAQI